MSLVVRTWNLFHGNTVPPGRRAYLREMVELVTADRPAVVCLQEVPVWALAHLQGWSGGMTSTGIVAAPPRLGSAMLGRLLTELHHGLLRSAFTGQANAILVDRPVDGRPVDGGPVDRRPVDRAVIGERTLTVSSAGERRVCQAVTVDGLVVVNFHVTGGVPADEQFARVVEFAEPLGDQVVIAGDANLRPGSGTAYERLRALGFSAPLPDSIDQIVVRGVDATPPRRWPDEDRRYGTRLLSDHAPVELVVG
jgi:endonuclease/exonuclease/phosphatase family metal-dependent hydrolase